MLRIGLVGYGVRGTAMLEAFSDIPNCQVAICAEKDQARLEQCLQKYPDIQCTTDYRDVLNAELDGVVIATPALSHYRIARDMLLADKHVWVAPPITRSSFECLDLIEIAESRGLTLMTGNALERDWLFGAMRNTVRSGDLGEILYIQSTHKGLRPEDAEVGILWDLGARAVAQIAFLLGRDPQRINAQGIDYFRKGIEDVGTLSMQFDSRVMAFIHCSWLESRSEQYMTIVGTRKTLVFEVAEERRKIYTLDHLGQRDIDGNIRPCDVHEDGGVATPAHLERLTYDGAHFLECILTRKTPQNSGDNGLRVVRTLEAAARSLEAEGNCVFVAGKRSRVAMGVKDAAGI